MQRKERKEQKRQAYIEEHVKKLREYAALFEVHKERVGASKHSNYLTDCADRMLVYINKVLELMPEIREEYFDKERTARPFAAANRDLKKMGMILDTIGSVAVSNKFSGWEHYSKKGLLKEIYSFENMLVVWKTHRPKPPPERDLRQGGNDSRWQQ